MGIRQYEAVPNSSNRSRGWDGWVPCVSRWYWVEDRLSVGEYEVKRQLESPWSWWESSLPIERLKKRVLLCSGLSEGRGQRRTAVKKKVKRCFCKRELLKCMSEEFGCVQSELNQCAQLMCVCLSVGRLLNNNHITRLQNGVFSGLKDLKYLWVSSVYWTVHHCNSWRMKDQLDVTCYFISLIMRSTCFGH